ncbi:MAG: RidA family protein [Candidatus Melainabacteria bacterium]|nr:RidA family protein [Candidatus Melainabacteria bacterium]
MSTITTTLPILEALDFVPPGGHSLAAWNDLLPEPPAPVASYVPATMAGNLLYTAGCLPSRNGQVLYEGAMGGFAIPLEHGQKAARLCAINCLSIIKANLGHLGRVKQVVKVTGYVSSVASFTDQPKVLNGASDFLVQVFGEPVGRHARAAVGVVALPLNASVEVDLVVLFE